MSQENKRSTGRGGGVGGGGEGGDICPPEYQVEVNIQMEHSLDYSEFFHFSLLETMSSVKCVKYQV